MKKRTISILLAVIFAIAFAVFTYLVKTYDVQAIGPLGSEVGFASFNKALMDGIEPNQMLYELTQFLGYFSIFICLIFAVIGLSQLIKRKSLAKVDKDIICLGILYLLAIAAYVIFEIKAVNYRPVLEDGVLGSSYPSSHTVLSICVFASLIVEIKRHIGHPGKALIEEMACLAMICLIIGLRFLSGWHWASDIIGGILLSLTFIFIFISILPEKRPKGKD